MNVATDQAGPREVTRPAVVGSRSGVIIALRNYHRYLESRVALDSASNREAEVFRQEADAALSMIEDLLRMLPASHVVASSFAAEYSRTRAMDDAEGRATSIMASKLRKASVAIEPILERCRSISISTDIEAVADATRACYVAARKLPAMKLQVTRGDAMGINMQGASLSCVLSSGAHLELSLRKAHPDYDSGIESGTWLIEGGALLRSQQRENPCVEILLGRELPHDITSVLVSEISALANAGADVRHLRSVN